MLVCVTISQVVLFSIFKWKLTIQLSVGTRETFYMDVHVRRKRTFNNMGTINTAIHSCPDTPLKQNEVRFCTNKKSLACSCTPFKISVINAPFMANKGGGGGEKP